MSVDNYILGILWAIGRYVKDGGTKYFFLRHHDRYFLDVAKRDLRIPANTHTVTNRGKLQYRLKMHGFNIYDLERLGWQPRWSEQRDYPSIPEHRDFIRAYIEMHSSPDTFTIRKKGRSPYKQPRLRIYGNKYFLEELTEIISSETGAGVKKVQKATNKSEVSGVLYYTSLPELQGIAEYLYRPVVRHFHRGYYEKLKEMLRRFER